MTDLPEELGRSIINTIMHTPVSNDKEAEREAKEIEERIVAARKDNAKRAGNPCTGKKYYGNAKTTNGQSNGCS